MVTVTSRYTITQRTNSNKQYIYTHETSVRIPINNMYILMKASGFPVTPVTYVSPVERAASRESETEPLLKMKELVAGDAPTTCLYLSFIGIRTLVIV